MGWTGRRGNALAIQDPRVTELQVGQQHGPQSEGKPYRIGLPKQDGCRARLRNEHQRRPRLRSARLRTSATLVDRWQLSGTPPFAAGSDSR